MTEEVMETYEIGAKEKTRWLSPGVAGIGLASFLADVGHEIPTALMPGFFTSTLGAPAAALGLVEGLADGAAGLARLGGGALSDDPERRRGIAAGGYASTAVLAALIGLTFASWQAGLLRVGAWAARGFRVPARNALLADLVPPEACGRAFGFERAMDNLGAIVGPLLALALVTAVGVRTAMLLSVIPGLLAAAAIVYAIRYLPRLTARQRQPIRLQVRPLLHGRLGRLMLGVAAFELGNVAATLLILRASRLLEPTSGQDTAMQMALGLYVLYNVAATVASIPAGRMGDSRGSTMVLAAGVLFFFLTYVGLAIGPTDLVLLAICFGGAGVAIGCVETAQHASVASLAPTEVRGSAFGLLAGIQGFGNLAASAVAGLLWTLVSGGTAFLYLAAWMLVALAGVLAASISSERFSGRILG